MYENPNLVQQVVFLCLDGCNLSASLHLPWVDGLRSDVFLRVAVLLGVP